MGTNKIRGLVSVAAHLLFLANTTAAAGCLCTHTPATLVDVIDGNTIILDIEGQIKTVHVYGIDTPKLAQNDTGTWCEKEGVKALGAMQYARALLKNAKEITLEEKAINSAGEVIANVYVDQLSLGQELLYKFFAIRSGDPKTWCD